MMMRFSVATPNQIMTVTTEARVRTPLRWTLGFGAFDEARPVATAAPTPAPRLSSLAFVDGSFADKQVQA